MRVFTKIVDNRFGNKTAGGNIRRSRYRGLIDKKMIDAYAKALDRSVSDTVRIIAEGMFTGFVKNSPVLTGVFRASWNFSVGSIDMSVQPRIPGAKQDKNLRMSEEEASQIALDKMKSGLSKVTANQPVFITNAVSYARVLEEGYSKKAPQGIVSKIFPQEVAKMRRALRAASKK